MQGYERAAENHVASEEAVYRALIDTAGGEPKGAEIEIQSVPKKPIQPLQTNRIYFIALHEKRFAMVRLSPAD
jgi:hypothetical protein